MIVPGSLIFILWGHINSNIKFFSVILIQVMTIMYDMWLWRFWGYIFFYLFPSPLSYYLSPTQLNNVQSHFWRNLLLEFLFLLCFSLVFYKSLFSVIVIHWVYITYIYEYILYIHVFSAQLLHFFYFIEDHTYCCRSLYLAVYLLLIFLPQDSNRIHNNLHGKHLKNSGTFLPIFLSGKTDKWTNLQPEPSCHLKNELWRNMRCAKGLIRIFCSQLFHLLVKTHHSLILEILFLIALK